MLTVVCKITQSPQVFYIDDLRSYSQDLYFTFNGTAYRNTSVITFPTDPFGI